MGHSDPRKPRVHYMHGPSNLLFILIVGIAIVLGGRKAGPALQELVRGGPRPPSHPLGGDDSKFLNRPRSRPSREF
jgi:hypothetical protein